MAGIQGRFVWYELMTADSRRAREFYRHVVGWEAKDADGTDASYTVLSAGKADVAGILQSRGASGRAGPFWMGYIGVEDVDAFTDRVEKAGGTVHHQPGDIPNVGRFSVVADPGGAVFALFQAKDQPAPDALHGAERTPGRIMWHELHAADGKAEFEFYSGLFGWTRGEAMDMGPMGTYQIFSTGGPPVGAVMTKTREMPSTLWLFYVSVDAADAAADRVREAGGKVLLPPQEVPGGDWIVQGSDPEGAMFALVASKR